MPRPEPIRDGTQIVRDRHTVRPPDTDDRGGRLNHRPIARPTRDVTIINNTINNTTIINNVRDIHRHSHNYRRDHDYWYEHGGTRYCHRYDSIGIHWFGFYVGTSYYWTRYHHDRFWWHDARRDRWVYWHNGSWWWQDPVRVDIVYIYVDNSDNYYRYEPTRGGVVVRPEQPASPPAQPQPGQPAPAPAQPEETVFYSDDGTRMIQVFGERKEAFLYDASEEEPKFMSYLADDVAEVQFSTDDEKPLQILVITERKVTKPDGKEEIEKSFLLFDASGKPFNEAPSEGRPGDAPAEPTPGESMQKGLEGSPALQEAGALVPQQN